MDDLTLSLLIQQKLADGRLPHDDIPRVWGGPGAGETCAACDLRIHTQALVMEGMAEIGRKPLQLHVHCFHLWDAGRRNAYGVVAQ